MMKNEKKAVKKIKIRVKSRTSNLKFRDMSQTAGKYEEQAIWLMHHQKAEDAEEYLHSAWEICRKIFSNSNEEQARTDLVQCGSRLATLLLQQGRLDETEEICNMSLDALAEVERGEDMLTAAFAHNQMTVWVQLAECTCAKGQYYVAQHLFLDRAIEISRNLFLKMQSLQSCYDYSDCLLKRAKMLMMSDFCEEAEKDLSTVEKDAWLRHRIGPSRDTELYLVKVKLHRLDLLLKAGNDQGADKEDLEILQMIHKLHRGEASAEILKLMASFYILCGDLNMSKDMPEKARNSYSRGYEFAKKLVYADLTNHSEYLLAYACFKMKTVSAGKEKSEYYQEALALMRDLSMKNPRNRYFEQIVWTLESSGLFGDDYRKLFLSYLE